MVEPDDKRLRFVPIEEATVPPVGLIEHIKDYWWVVHPEKGVVFWRPNPRVEVPQGNFNKVVTEGIIKRMYPWAECRLIPSVFRSIDPKDYV